MENCGQFVNWRHQRAQWEYKHARAIEFDWANILAIL